MKSKIQTPQLKRNYAVRKIKLLLTSLLLLPAVFSHAQWQSDTRLTNDNATSYTSYSNASNIATAGDTVHVVWSDSRDGNPEIYYKRSTDGGLTWGADTRLTNDAADSQFPAIAILDSVIHIVFDDTRSGDDEIYYMCSTDFGASWGTDTMISENDGQYSGYPSISASAYSQVINIAWEDARDGNLEIYCKRSLDGGFIWSQDVRLTNNNADSENPCLSVSGYGVYVVWKDARDGNNEIYFKHSTDGGINWTNDIRLTNNTAHSNGASVVATATVVHVAWYDERDGNREIYYKGSTDGGTNWSTDTRLTNDTAASNNPSISMHGSVVHVAWHDERNGNKEIYYKRSIDGGMNWEADVRLTNAAGVSGRPSVSVSGSVVHVAWYDERDGNAEIYYKRNPVDGGVGIDVSFENEDELQFFPNPFSDKINISAGSNELCELMIYDVTSKMVVHKEFTNAVTLHTSALEKGIYLFEVRSKSTIIKRGKLVKM